jgi:hypothetical protein
MSAAQGDLSRLLGPNDPATCLTSLNVAIALDALGRPQDALTIVRHAEPILRTAMGAQAPTYLRMKALQADLERTLASASPRTRRAYKLEFFT